MPATSSDPSPGSGPVSCGTLTASSAASSSPRRAFLRAGGAVGALGVAGVVGAGYLNYRPGHDRQLVFGTLAAAMQEAERLAAAAVLPLAANTAWNWSQTLVHCAQSIEFSLLGFPESRSALFQNTVGAAAFKVFAARGRMSHNLAEPIPGAPALQAHAPDASAALVRLRKAAQDFVAHAGPLQPHFAYGALTRAEYEQAHAMHLAEHLSAFDVRG